MLSVLEQFDIDGLQLLALIRAFEIERITEFMVDLHVVR